MRIIKAFVKVLFKKELDIRSKDNFGPPVRAGSNWICGPGSC